MQRRSRDAQEKQAHGDFQNGSRCRVEDFTKIPEAQCDLRVFIRQEVPLDSGAVGRAADLADEVGGEEAEGEDHYFVVEAEAFDYEYSGGEVLAWRVSYVLVTLAVLCDCN